MTLIAKRTGCILLIISCLCGSCFAQNPLPDTAARKFAAPGFRSSGPGTPYLALDYRGGRHRFFAGDEIRLRLHGERRSRSLSIHAFTDSSLVEQVWNEFTARPDFLEYPFRQINRVYLHRGGSLVRQAGVYLPLAGAMYILMDTFSPLWNNTYQGSKIYLSPATAAIGGGLAGLGLLARRSSRRNLKIGPANRLLLLKSN